MSSEKRCSQVINIAVRVFGLTTVAVVMLSLAYHPGKVWERIELPVEEMQSSGNEHTSESPSLERVVRKTTVPYLYLFRKKRPTVPHWAGYPIRRASFLQEPSREEFAKAKSVFYVYTSLFNFEKRNKMRELRLQLFPGEDIRMVFVIGSPTSKQSLDFLNKEKLLKEMLDNHDLLQINMTDTYTNLGYKGLFFLDWIISCCSKVEMIIKVDDDNHEAFRKLPFRISKLREQSVNLTNAMACANIHTTQKAHKVYGKKEWNANAQQYSAPYFPSYCNGDRGTIFSIPVARKLLEASRSETVFHIDDIFMSGLLRHRANVEIKGFSSNVWSDQLSFDPPEEIVL